MKETPAEDPVADLHAALAEQRRLVYALRDQSFELERQRSLHERTRRDHERRVAGLETALAEADARLAEQAASAGALGEAEQRASAAEREREQLSTELDVRDEGLADARKAAAAAGRERDELQSQLTGLEQAAAHLSAQVEELQGEREAARNELHASAGALGEAEQRASAAEREREQLSTELDVRDEGLADARNAAAAAGRERDELQSQLTGLEQAAAQFRAQVEELQGEREAIAKVVVTTADALRHAERKASTAELVRDQVQASLRRLEDESQALAAARDELQVHAEQLESARRLESSRVASISAARAELLAQLEREGKQRQVHLEALASHIDRAATSRSFRFGHRFFRTLAVLSFRRPKSGRSALDAASEAVVEIEEMERRALPARSEAEGGDETPQADEPSEPGPPASAGLAREHALRASFHDRYAALRTISGSTSLSEDEMSGRLPRDTRSVLVSSHVGHPHGHSADVIVCVKDALEDVRSCLWSLLHYTEQSFRLIVVDDGSQAPTRSALEQLVAREPAVELIRNEGPEHGYTRAANLGLRAATADYAVLLNSDTIVTPGWLDRLIACGESDEAIGVIGPLSNAASHQSIPHVKDNGGWAVNELPRWLTPATMAYLVASLSSQARPRLPFVNGFCYAIKREALESVGLLDEERFGAGYCEENDFSLRLQDAGFALAIADDAYVFHAKSRSYAPQGRAAIAGENYKVFLRKHGPDRVASFLERLNREDGLADLRRAASRATDGPDATIEAFKATCPRPLEVLFVLHGMSQGSGGGSHSIYQEARGMRRLGIPAQIALGAKGLDHARAAYPDADSIFVPFRDYEELRAIATGADVVVATHYTTVSLLQRLQQDGNDFLPAYYVQDYEPFFLKASSPRLVEAAGSYTALPDLLLFAKTHWLCNLVGAAHGVHVAKVEPSIDESLFNSKGRSDPENGEVRVTAMIRPRTPRRQPGATLAALHDLQRQRPDRVQITTFGCHSAEFDAVGAGTSAMNHRGILKRDEVSDLFRTSDVFLDLSTYQAFGRTALEAMACGCTAVVPAIGGVHEFARHDQNAILVDSLQPEAAVADLLNLVDDAERLARLQRRASDTSRRYSVLKASLSEYALFTSFVSDP